MLVELMIPLVATILIELGVLYLLGERNRCVLWSSVVVNGLTNVPLNLWAKSLPTLDWTDVLLGESLVVVVETLWYWWFVRSLKRACVYGFLCNATSYLVGLLVVLLIAFLTD